MTLFDNHLSVSFSHKLAVRTNTKSCGCCIVLFQHYLDHVFKIKCHECLKAMVCLTFATCHLWYNFICISKLDRAPRRDNILTISWPAGKLPACHLFTTVLLCIPTAFTNFTTIIKYKFVCNVLWSTMKYCINICVNPRDLNWPVCNVRVLI